jgi:hypothetical protein
MVVLRYRPRLLPHAMVTALFGAAALLAWILWNSTRMRHTKPALEMADHASSGP